MSNLKPLLMVGGKAYVEQDSSKMRGVPCDRCAFGGELAKCGIAIGTTPTLFGGDCIERDVIYIPAMASVSAARSATPGEEA